MSNVIQEYLVRLGFRFRRAIRPKISDRHGRRESPAPRSKWNLPGDARPGLLCRDRRSPQTRHPGSCDIR